MKYMILPILPMMMKMHAIIVIFGSGHQFLTGKPRASNPLE